MTTSLALFDSRTLPDASVTRWCWRLATSCVRIAAAELDGSFGLFNKESLEVLNRLLRLVEILDKFADASAVMPTDSAVDCCLGKGVTARLREESRDPMGYVFAAEKIVYDYAFRLMANFYDERQGR